MFTRTLSAVSMMTAALISQGWAQGKDVVPQNLPQTATVGTDTGTGRAVICKEAWTKVTDPKIRNQIGDTAVPEKVAKAYFIDACKQRLKARVAGTTLPR